MGNRTNKLTLTTRQKNFGDVKQTERDSSGFRRGVNEILALLGCCAAQNDSHRGFGNNPSVPSSMVKHLLGTDSLYRYVGNYQFTLRSIPGNQTS
jgi:hypothetical protein